jgi:broad-specificity NMP kinase
MPAYLITSRGGVGKSAVCQELQTRGFAAFDGDTIPGLARWEDHHTKAPITVDASGFVDYSRVDWNWQTIVMERFVAEHSGSGLLFLCGSASNQELFYPCFKKVFVLTIDPETHKKRLANRESDYGKDPAMQRALVADQQRFAAETIASGGIAIHAGSPLPEIVDEILRYAA